MFVHTVIMVIEPHMKQGRQHKLISTIFLATSVTKKLDHNNQLLEHLLPAGELYIDKSVCVVQIAAVHTEKAFDALVELRFVVVQKERKI